jgi:N-acyl-D-aspartate/D-glutamate deacylase
MGMHDLLISGGTVLDGTGAAGVRADVAVDGDRITAVGDLPDAEGRQHIDATGMVVTPGFVDLHTHLDAQIAWDPLMTSSSWHGVTTALIGNCGVSFAPAAPGERRYLAEMMESVEDIPRDAILESLPWDWETYPEYLDSVQRMRPALNVVGLVGHSAIRYHVMGERSLDDQPTAEERARMSEVAEAAVSGGAVGFSTSRLTLHRVPDGRCVPGTFAESDELLAIVDGMNRAGGGVFQAVLNETKIRDEFDMLRSMAERGADVLFSGSIGNDAGRAPRIVERYGEFLSDARATSGPVTALAMTRPSGLLLGLHQVTPAHGPAWAELMALPTLAERVASIRQAGVRRALVEDAERKGITFGAERVHPLGTAPQPDHLGPSLAELGEQAGVHPIEIVLDQLLETDGQALFCAWFFNAAHEHMADFLALDGICPGLADTGAHAGQICDADTSTYYLAHFSRDRGVVGLEDAVHRLTAKPAAVLGLVDRGELRTGAFADLNVFDPDRLSFGYPRYSNDFPNGTGRFSVGSTGYAATVVNGEVVTEQGANTGARPGRVLRDFSRS